MQKKQSTTASNKGGNPNDPDEANSSEGEPIQLTPTAALEQRLNDELKSAQDDYDKFTKND